jgi:hypothetical protein
MDIDPNKPAEVRRINVPGGRAVPVRILGHAQGHPILHQRDWEELLKALPRYQCPSCNDTGKVAIGDGRDGDAPRRATIPCPVCAGRR